MEESINRTTQTPVHKDFRGQVHNVAPGKELGYEIRHPQPGDNCFRARPGDFRAWCARQAPSFRRDGRKAAETRPRAVSGRRPQTAGAQRSQPRRIHTRATTSGERYGSSRLYEPMLGAARSSPVARGEGGGVGPAVSQTPPLASPQAKAGASAFDDDDCVARVLPSPYKASIFSKFERWPPTIMEQRPSTAPAGGPSGSDSGLARQRQMGKALRQEAAAAQLARLPKNNGQAFLQAGGPLKTGVHARAGAGK